MNAETRTIEYEEYMHPLLAAIVMPLSSLAILGFTWWRLGPTKTQPVATDNTPPQVEAGRRLSATRKIPTSASA